MFLSKLEYSELVQRLFEKMTFFLVDPLMVVTRSGAYTQPSTPHTDSTVPMSSIYGDMEARILHHFMGGIDLDETGAAQRQAEATDWAQLWTELDCFVGYTGDEGCHVLSFNKSTRRGECGLNADGTFILFPLFLPAWGES